MTLPKHETKLFDDLRDIEVENFLLLEIKGRPIIAADMSEEQDGSEIMPLYGRLSDSEAQKLLEVLEEDAGDDEDEPRRVAPKTPKRWKG